MDGRLGLLLLLFTLQIHASPETRKWVRLKARDSTERTHIAEHGVAIEVILSDYVIGIAADDDLKPLRGRGLVLEEQDLASITPLDFPAQDQIYHNYDELTDAMKEMATQNPDLIQIDSLGQSVEGREIWHMTISGHSGNSDVLPAVVFLGGHHAREHLSVETPLLLTKKWIQEYRAGNPNVITLMKARQIHVVPAVNPDGLEFDVTGSRYQYWRKNRGLVNNRPQGIDLNRNYGFGWGGSGSSGSPGSETYRGPAPFSEPETQAIKKFIEQQTNLTTVLSFHTFSQLILYPWGHVNGQIPAQDYEVHKKMAETMAAWNQYEPMQSADLYLGAGDATDWTYGVHHLISFTFELDPGGGQMENFYPGAAMVDVTVQKNWQPFIYLIEYADNPYRVLEANYIRYGLNSPLVD
jgi:carboxypeptidase T